MPIFTLHGVTIEVPKGGRSATAYRPAVVIDGQLVQTEARAEFGVIPEGPTPQVQATRWALALPRIEEYPVEPETEVDEVTDGE